MSLHEHALSHAQKAFRDVPGHRRLRTLNRFFVREIEQLGYDLAHEMDQDTVSSVFVAAHDVENRLNALQCLIDAQAAQCVPPEPT